MKKMPLRDQKYELLRIMREHDVGGMRDFIKENAPYFEQLSEESIADDNYLFDLIHVYKAHTFHLGPLYIESMRDGLDKGLITLSEETKEHFERLEADPEEIQECVITPELGRDKLQ